MKGTSSSQARWLPLPDTQLFLATITSQVKNEADTSIYSTEKSLQEYKDKLPQAVIDEINKALQEARDASQVSEGPRGGAGGWLDHEGVWLQGVGP